MAPIRWGIASAGLISSDFVNAIDVSPYKADHEVVAVAARSQAKAEEFAKTFGIKKAYGGYEKLAEDPDIDVVYVGTINTAHLENCLMLIKAGKNILCEKPLGMNVKETKQILEAAQAKNVFFMEAMWARCNPLNRKMQEEIKNGVLGEVMQANATFGAKMEVDRVLKKDLGGGGILDIGIYAINFLQMAFGDEVPEKIIASGNLSPEGVDHSVSVIFRYKNGKMGCFSLSTQVELANEAQVCGTDGQIKVEYPMWAPNRMNFKGKELKIDLPESKIKFNFPNSAALVFEAEHVRECLQNGLKQSDLVPHSLTLTIAEIMENIRKQVGVEYPQDR
ncbi:hypothetical protein TCAL_00997 [Tigriopus californicus]|uniref:Trans-1,2-dihydrobenzene-1,2-diol dehydrogenase n=1 Tax=Tigriopus californicus TaxID=6832 RepID=A0A553P4E2_TIGCA|nr:trans-1,2-dihydrobenzene-1,2-diol dehydrogenase-like [Tigriopus californicus]TRY72556.1 hypothetical protein TCAL_00997 [Tigriopus californicus]|eukprot:TCALIF_00997-PA protein Name:"Similar to dhdh Trans-1,2-dihydrobenzene-1,2-diol dehydrogenase (Danio rerio)" AED:0.15 eAED:0.15 QI:0/-1/0/1/-1/1/1/0/334